MHSRIQVWIAITLISILSICCRGIVKQQQCLKEHFTELGTTPEYDLIRSAARDTISHWSTLGLENFNGINRTKWVIDSAVLFNENKSRALLLLLEVDTVFTAKLDYVKVVAAEKKEGKWFFYVQSLPSLIFDRSNNPIDRTSRPYTLDELSQMAREELIRGGYYKWRSCSVNYEYVNAWFGKPLGEYHQDFLRRRI